MAPDETTFAYLKGREFSPKGKDWDKAVEYWRTLRSGEDAVFDKEYVFDAADISPMITYGTNPGMGMPVDGTIPSDTAQRALDYMGFSAGERLLGHKIDYVFLGAAPTAGLRTSVPSPRSLKAAERLTESRPGSCLVRGPSDVRLRKKDLTGSLRMPDSRSASLAVRPVLR